MRGVRQWNALPVLDQNERQHHLCKCRLSQLVSVMMLKFLREAARRSTNAPGIAGD